MEDLVLHQKKRESFYKTIIESLRLAEVNPEFRAVFATTIEGACATCGDRVSLSVLQLGVQRRLAQVDKTDLKAVAKLLKGLQSMNLLEETARQKVTTLRFVDEIEVYLGYPIKLKERLHLPIDMENMLYFACSSLTERDLKDAEDYVLSFLNNEDSVTEFLVSKEEWISSLKKSCPERCQEIEDKKEKDLESDDPDYVAIDTAYKKALKDLTKEVLHN